MIDIEYVAIDKREAEAIGVIGSRLIAARQLAGHAQNVAAELLGLDVNELRGFENRLDIDRIPAWVIIRAAECYHVSTDYLYGLTDDWDAHDPEAGYHRDWLSCMQRIHIESYSKVLAGELRRENRVQALCDVVATLAPAVSAISEAMMRFWELNQDFDDMKGGATVIKRLDEAEKAAERCQAKLIKSKCLPAGAHLQSEPASLGE